MHQEVKQITPRLLEIYPVFRQAAVEKHGSTYWNIPGVALSLLFQTCEKHIILACYDFWRKTRGYEPGALVHDGMHIKSDEEWLEAGIIKVQIFLGILGIFFSKNQITANAIIVAIINGGIAIFKSLSLS